jgi:hypothetical protein
MGIFPAAGKCHTKAPIADMDREGLLMHAAPPAFLALALILLTSLDGKPIWVESSAVVIIRTQSHECQDGHGSVIRVGSNALCVREKPDQIRELIYNADRH